MVFPMKKVNETIRNLREKNNWSQEDMASKLSMSTNGYAKLERGETRLYLNKLERIAEVFDIDVLELITPNDKNIVLISEHSSLSSNYYANSESADSEIEKLKLIIAHKDELLKQQEKEIFALQKVITLLEK